MSALRPAHGGRQPSFDITMNLHDRLLASHEPLTQTRERPRILRRPAQPPLLDEVSVPEARQVARAAVAEHRHDRQPITGGSPQFGAVP